MSYSVLHCFALQWHCSNATQSVFHTLVSCIAMHCCALQWQCIAECVVTGEHCHLSIWIVKKIQYKSLQVQVFTRRQDPNNLGLVLLSQEERLKTGPSCTLGFRPPDIDNHGQILPGRWTVYTTFGPL